MKHNDPYFLKTAGQVTPGLADLHKLCDAQAGSIATPIGVVHNVQPPFDTVGFIMDWENGQLDFDDEVEGFQHMINSGLAWQLQGCYGRRAMELINSGECGLPK